MHMRFATLLPHTDTTVPQDLSLALAQMKSGAHGPGTRADASRGMRESVQRALSASVLAERDGTMSGSFLSPSTHQHLVHEWSNRPNRERPLRAQARPDAHGHYHTTTSMVRHPWCTFLLLLLRPPYLYPSAFVSSELN